MTTPEAEEDLGRRGTKTKEFHLRPVDGKGLKPILFGTAKRKSSAGTHALAFSMSASLLTTWSAGWCSLRNSRSSSKP